MKKYKAVIYDIDGTILDTLKMNMIPLQRIIKEELGIDYSYEQVLKFASYPGMKVMEELNIKDKEKTYARWVQYVNDYEEGASVYLGIREVLETVHKYMRQAVVSAKTKKQYEIDVVSKGLDQFMETAVLADDTTLHKPDPAPILLCLERLNVEKEEVIYIGDALSDYLCCQAAGVDFGYALWGSVSDEGIVDPTFTFHQPIDLLKLIDFSSKENIKMIVSDIDGTLLNDQEELTEKTKQALVRLKQNGYLFGLASGRPLCSIEKLIKQWQAESLVDFILGINGGHIKDYRLNKEEKYYTIDGEDIKTIIDHFDGYPVNFGVYLDDTLGVMKEDELAVRLSLSDGIDYQVIDFDEICRTPQSKLIVMSQPEDMPLIKAHGEKLKSTAFKSVQAGKIEYEFMHPDLSKSFALKKIAAWNNISLKQIIAFGDADNDAEIIKEAGIGVAMGNASPQTKKNADYITLDHQHNGVACFINSIFLDKEKKEDEDHRL